MDSYQSPTDAQASAINTETALEAILGGDIYILEKLLQEGIDINHKYENGQTLLHNAVVSDNKELVKLWLNKDAIVNAKNIDDESPLHESVRRCRKAKVRILLEADADVNAKNKVGQTPLCLASTSRFRNKIDIVKLLINKGADPNIKTKHGETPLYEAALNGNLKLTKILLENGADINSTADGGISVLHIAVLSGSKDIVQLLIDNGANVHAKTEQGETVLHKAIWTDGDALLDRDMINMYLCEDSWNWKINKEIIELLLQHNADINAQTNDGLSVLALAREREKRCSRKVFCGNCLSVPFIHSRQITTLLQRHIIKQKSAGFYLNKENLEKYPFDMFDYQTECNKEISYLKSEFIHDGISLFDLLSKPTSQLTYYLNNSNITKSLNLSNIKKECEHYYNMIYSKVQNAVRRKELLEYGERFFNILSVSLPMLPYVCREYILSYLSNADLIILEKLFK